MERRHEALLAALGVLLVGLIYFNTLGGPFVLDDERNILNNPHIRLTNVTLEALTDAGFSNHLATRPVAYISFALNYYWGGYHATGYHLVNLLIHLITGVLLYSFIKNTLKILPWDDQNGSYRWVPFFTALIWLVHPLQTQSVTYVVQRMNSLAALFYLLSFWLYIKTRLQEGKGWKRALMAAGSILAGLLAFGSKEIAATLPLFILLYEWYFFQGLSRNWLKRHAPLFTALLIFLAFVAFLYLGPHPLERITSLYAKRDFTLNQRLLTEFRVVIFYISLLFLPHPSRLNLEHDFPLSHSVIEPLTTAFAMGAIGALAGLALCLARKERLLSFCLLWFLGNLVIESSVIGLEIIFEHRNYLPSMMVALMTVTLICRYIKSKQLAIGGLCAIVLVCSFWTHERNRAWNDEITLLRDCVKKSPEKFRPHYNLGIALAEQGRTAEAIAHYRQALRIAPDHPAVHNNLGVELAAQGRTAEAIAHYTTALRLKPDFVRAHINLGNALAAQGKLGKATMYYAQAVRLKPKDAMTHTQVGNALMKHGRTQEAIQRYTAALRLNSGLAETHNNLGAALIREGKIDAAITCFRDALRINPGYLGAQKNLQYLLAVQKPNHGKIPGSGHVFKAAKCYE